jgi:hypothetical protein
MTIAQAPISRVETKFAWWARWHLYAIEGVLLGAFMVSACLFGVILEHPDSPVLRAIASPFVRRSIMGIAMGSTAIALIHSPFGLRSGALMNPATRSASFASAESIGATHFSTSRANSSAGRSRRCSWSCSLVRMCVIRASM